MARAFYAENRRVANGKAKRLLGWRPAYPDYRLGLRALNAMTSPIPARPAPAAASGDHCRPIRWPRNRRASSALGTSSIANTTATSPDVMQNCSRPTAPANTQPRVSSAHRSPFTVATSAIAMPATMKRYVTDQLGGTTPS
ncbi:hypothetical protein WR25_10355 [Diploscapter pachys]|uniref:NAD-dependent epimerase/dehydratase domain-containing protein n=1 Tax=Diploscapter pachys TaxID=2018661 RepID=A0A2A2JYL7_9BILA|nr:hypothetical protein WR25_10355 [Diploscapter pachys]